MYIYTCIYTYTQIIYVYDLEFSSHNFNSQNVKLRVSNLRTIACVRFKVPFESSNLPGAGPISTARSFENWPYHRTANVVLSWVALLVQRYLSSAASFVLCVFRRVKDHHSLLHHSPLLKKACVRQVVSDKRSP